MFAPRNHNSISSAAAASACSSSYPELLQTQLRALVRLAQRHDLRILVPMVTLAEEMERMRGLLRQAAGDLGVERLPPLGAMIETPAALCAAQIAIPIADCGLRIGKEVRSAEFGVRSDRHGIANCGLFTPHFALRTLHLKVSHYFIDDHPAVMRLVEMVVREAAETPVGLCGELAARKEVLPQLLGLGLRSLSVAPPRYRGRRSRRLNEATRFRGCAVRGLERYISNSPAVAGKGPGDVNLGRLRKRARGPRDAKRRG